jgi:peptidoglycan/xylan/chitin deacetylase (PgdA/CDA1 family)
LAYHAIGEPQGDPARELVPAMSPRLLDAQLSQVKRSYRLVAAAELPAAVAGRKRGERFPLAITFDDDLPSHVDEALPILKQHGVPATFFVCGASLDAPFAFWWERLQRAADLGLLSEKEASSLHERGAAIRSLTPTERDEVAGDLLELVGPDPPESGLRASSLDALREAGCAIGAHTVRHDPLTSLEADGLDAALRQGRSVLEGRLGQPVDLIAYPHGDADGRVAGAARQAGFSQGFTMAEHPTTPETDRLLIGRIEPPLGPPVQLAIKLLSVLARGAGAGE